MSTTRITTELEKETLEEKKLEAQAIEKLKKELLEGKSFYLNHKVALPRLVTFAKVNDLDFKSIEGGGCKAVSELQAFDRWLMSELKAGKEFSLETLEKLDILRKCAQIVTVEKSDDKYTQEETSAYLMIFSCVSDLKKIAVHKDFSFDKSYKALQNIFKVDTFSAQPITLLCYSYENIKKHAPILFSGEIMNFNFLTYATDTSTIIPDSVGHMVSIHQTQENKFNYYDTNSHTPKEIKSTDELVTALRDSVNKVNSTGGFLYTIWKYGDTHSISRETIKDIITKEDYKKEELSALLLMACRSGDIITAKICLENKADPSVCNSHGSTPLHIAIKIKNTELINLLLAHYKNKDPVDKHQKTPLFYAAASENLDICAILIEKGADLMENINLAFFHESHTALSTLLRGSLSLGYFDELEASLQALEDRKNKEPWKSETMTIYKNLVKTAVQSGHADVVKELFDLLSPYLTASENQGLKEFAIKTVAREGLNKDMLTSLPRTTPKEEKTKTFSPR